MASTRSTPAERDRLVSAMSQRVAEVSLAKPLKRHEAPDDALGRLFARLPPEPEPETFSISRDGELFHSDSMRANFTRAYLAVAAAEGTLVGHMRRISRWREPRVTAVYLATYCLLWYLDFLAAALFGLVLARLMYPTLFAAPIWSPWKLNKPKTVSAQTERDAEELGKEVGQVLAGAGSSPAPVVAGVEAAAAATGAAVTASSETAIVPAAPVAPKPASGIRGRVERIALPAQTGAGDVADVHERFANLFMGRGVSTAARNRVALHIVGLLLLVAIVPTRLIVRGSTAFAALMFFVISPLSSRYHALAVVLDPEATILRGLPTNAQLALQALREDPTIVDRVAAAEEPAAQVESGEKPTNKQRFASFVKSTMDLTERGADFFSGGAEASSSFTFFAVYGITPGHLVIVPRSEDEPARLCFKTGIALANRPRKELVNLPLSSLSAVRKVNGIAAVGLSATLGISGVGEGIEVDDVDGKTYSFIRCYRRNAAFLRILASDDTRWVIR